MSIIIGITGILIVASLIFAAIQGSLRTCKRPRVMVTRQSVALRATVWDVMEGPDLNSAALRSGFVVGLLVMLVLTLIITLVLGVDVVIAIVASIGLGIVVGGPLGALIGGRVDALKHQ